MGKKIIAGGTPEKKVKNRCTVGWPEKPTSDTLPFKCETSSNIGSIGPKFDGFCANSTTKMTFGTFGLWMVPHSRTS